MNAKAARFLSSCDPVMRDLIQRAGPIQLKPRRLPPFQSLVQSIIHQQLSGASAGAILKRFHGLFAPADFPTPDEVLRLDGGQLRGAGLSRPKATYIHDAARQTLAGVVPSLTECDGLSDAEIIDRLTAIKGVGCWTAQMLLIFNLGRPDVLPVDDLGVRRGFQIAYRKRNLPAPESLERFGRQWAPHRTTAAWYLWRATDTL